jgi:hypothetical protein
LNRASELRREGLARQQSQPAQLLSCFERAPDTFAQIS